MANKETSIGIKLTTDLRNYQKGMSDAKKTNSAFAKNAKASFGDAKTSISALAKGDITALPGLFKAAQTGAGGMSKGLHGIKAALIATGIGALVVGLGLAVGALTSYFKNTEEGQVVFMRVMNNIKAVTEPIISMFGKMGKALVHLFKGEFKEAWETAKEGVTSVGDNIKANIAITGELGDMEESLIKKKRENLLENKRLEAEIAEARNIAADDENYTAAQRAAAIAKAIDMQKQLAANKKVEADLELKIAETKASFGDNDIATNDKLVELKSTQFDILKEQETALKKLQSQQRTITGELSKQIEEQNKYKARLEEIATIESMGGFKKMETKTVETLTVNAPDAQLANMGPVLDANIEKLAELKAGFDAVANEENAAMLDSISGSFNTMGAAIGGTAGDFLGFAGFLLEQIPVLVSQISALTSSQVASSQAITTAKAGEALASGTAASQSVPFPGNLIALAATITSIIAAFKTKLKPPKLAKGGIAYGNTIAQVGEYSGARVNPEVIAPLDKLKGMLPQQQAPAREVFIPETKLRGEDILISYRKAAEKERKRN